MMVIEKKTWPKSIENIVAKEEIAPQEPFLPLPKYFQMAFAVECVKTCQYKVKG
jgi:hypothetical protein